MVLCFVPTCKNRSDRQNWKKDVDKKNRPKITFHSIPKNVAKRSLWLDILGINSSTPTARICSAHFDEESFDRTSLSLTRLRPDALPRRESKTEIKRELSFSNFQTVIKTERLSPVDSVTKNLEIDEVSPPIIFESCKSEDSLRRVLILITNNPMYENSLSFSNFQTIVIKKERLSPVNSVTKNLEEVDEVSPSIIFESIIKIERSSPVDSVTKNLEEVDEVSTSILETIIKKERLSPVDSITKHLEEVDEVSTSILETTQPSISKATADKATMISSDLIYNSPKECRLRRRIKFLKKEHAKKVKSLQQNLRYSANKIAKLKNILNILKRDIY